MRKPEQTNLAHAASIDPGIKTYPEAQNSAASPEAELAVTNPDVDADRASEAAWKDPQTLAAALGKKRVERVHGTMDGQPALKIEHDPYRTYQAHMAEVKKSDGPVLQADRLHEGVFSHAEIAGVEAAERLAHSDYEAPVDKAE